MRHISPLRVRLPIWIVCAFFACLTAGRTYGQGPDRVPTMSVKSRFDSPRSHAPLQFEATVAWRYPEVLEGRLILDLYVSEKKVHTWIGREVALSESEITLPVMVHPLVLPSEQTPLDVDVRFETADRTYRPEDQLDLPYWVDWKRMQVIGVIHPGQRLSLNGEFSETTEDESALFSPFRLDSYLPDREFSRHLASRIEVVSPDAAPSTSLEWLGFDMVIVTSSGLRGMNSANLESLAEWAEAGGLVCVAAHLVTDPIQTRFLQRLSGSTPTDPRLLFGPTGTVTSADPDSPDRLSFRTGIGRSLLILRPIVYSDPKWREEVTTFWRMRSNQRQHVAKYDRFEFPQEAWPRLLANPSYLPLEMDGVVESELPMLLLPDRVEGVPLRTVAVILVLCLLAIGPIEYVALSALGRRRWTWIVFPSVALMFTFYTIRLAQHHMGQADARRSLTVIDLAADGRPVRESRFELLFAASEKQIVEEHRETLVSPWEHREATIIDPNSIYQRPRRTSPAAYYVTEAIEFEGRAPLNYRAIRSARQWMPQLVRRTTLGSKIETPIPELPWEEITVERVKDDEERTRLLSELQSAVPHSRAFLLHRDRSYGASPPPSPESPLASSPEGAEPGETESLADKTAAFCLMICSQPQEGLFRILGQISPNAGGNLQDLAILDRSEPGQWLLVIISADEQGNTRVLRRVLHEGDR